MLNSPMTHPELVGALAAAGHGSTVLLADGNYPAATGGHPAARRVFLNLRAGLLDVDDVLHALVETVPLEAAAVMVPGDGRSIPAHDSYRQILPTSVTWREIERLAFYEECRGPDLAVLVATGDTRLYANLLLTIGVRTPPV